jgi:cobalamin biosynthesis Co2+ chelatase CbiK
MYRENKSVRFMSHVAKSRRAAYLTKLNGTMERRDFASKYIAAKSMSQSAPH